MAMATAMRMTAKLLLFSDPSYPKNTAVDLRPNLSLFRQSGFAASRQQKPENLSLWSFPLKLQTALAPGGSHPKALWSQGYCIKPVTQVTKRVVRTFPPFI